ncbi:LAT2 domain-containing protein isoform X1 [Brienomyrus brachyistius]|uniref:LAT2 domain-containing protein isoform X1 n=1 Tax=Brienomyrus brachyistius TaxID=42636 RepID=UPI0020B3FB4A|nr:LAT2 domain-containing protein isoform X1 [Brienomyrus brachyistius]
MKTDASLGDAVLAIALFTSIGAILVGCLSCRKKDKIVQTKNSFYEHQHFHSGGRRITVTRSKRVTHFNKLCETSHAEIDSNVNDHPSVGVRTREPTGALNSGKLLQDCRRSISGTAENQPNYQNILIENGISEPAYVHPIGEGQLDDTAVYQNTSETDQDIPDYENVFTDTTACQQSEYANCDFIEDDDDEGDYVNG